MGKYRCFSLERMNGDDYTFFSRGSAQSVFQDFESCLRTECIPEDDNKLILEVYNQNFNTYGVPLDICTIKDLSEAFSEDPRSNGFRDGTLKTNTAPLAKENDY